MIRKTQMENRHEFWTTILDILKEDWSQTCNTAPGTNIRLESDGDRQSIIIGTGISQNTLKRLTRLNYLISCEENTGKLMIQDIVIGDE